MFMTAVCNKDRAKSPVSLEDRHKQIRNSPCGGFLNVQSSTCLKHILLPTTQCDMGSNQTSEVSICIPQDRDVKILGVSVGRRNIDFVRTRYVNQMGRVEDIAVGYGYSMSIGYGSPFYGSDRSETVLNWLFSSSLAHQDSLFLSAHADYTTRLSNEPRESVFKGRIKFVRKNLFYQTLAARLSTLFEFGREGESQVILDGENGIRGYSPYAFSGEKMIILKP